MLLKESQPAPLHNGDSAPPMLAWDRLLAPVGSMRKPLSSTGDLPTSGRGGMRVSGPIRALHSRCGVYTRSEIVNDILDAVGWTSDADLSTARLLEPAAGDGAFIITAAERLVLSLRRRGLPISASAVGDQIRAYEIHPKEALRARVRLKETLTELGIHDRTANALALRWIVVGDFLLTDLVPHSFSHIVGNPPYARWSRIPRSLRRTYERRLPRRMIKGDLFLPFLDLSIGYLDANGRLSFLCSDRWRFMAFAEGFRRHRLPEVIIERDEPLVAATAYVTDVDVYPSILVLRRTRQISSPVVIKAHPSQTTLTDAGCVIRVGPALGCTPAFVLDPGDDDIEQELLAPWLDGTEIEEGHIRWRGRRVIALHDANGELRSLRVWPRAAARLRAHREVLARRAIVRAGAPWYRPIDRVIAADWVRPKLLLPEMAKIPRIAIDRSGSVPSHGVYAIFAPNDEVEKIYQALAKGKLAAALDGIAPKVKGGYVRCYRRFLEMIPIRV
jgi:adenine-specific DNA-methyltransferase